MAEGTRSAVKQNVMDECLNRLARHEEQFTSFGHLLQEMNMKLTLLEAKLDQGQKQKTKVEGTTNEGLGSFFGNNALKSVKLTIPRFAGGNPEPWIHKIQQFYGFHNLTDPEKFTLTSFHMDGSAEEWYHWMDRNGRLRTWDQFVGALRARFGPSRYRDLRGELGRLTQVTTVADYQSQFEKLANQVMGIDDVSLQSYFESGLKSEIRKEVRMHLPASLEQAIDLAKIVEDKLNDKSTGRTYYNRAYTGPSNPSQPGLLPTPLAPPKLAITGSGNNKTNIPIKRLTAAEMMERREKGLCYYCNEKFNRTHVCKSKMFIMLVQDEDNEAPDKNGGDELIMDMSTEKMEGEIQSMPEINLHAMAGQHSTSTLRIQGRIGNTHVQILVDGGSTHNFIQARLVKFLGLDNIPTQKFQVLVGNGEVMDCLGVCSQVEIEIQGHHFRPDLYVLPLQGAEVVLGVQWLSEWGDITINYRDLVMRFEREGQQVELQGAHNLTMEAIQLHQLRKLQSSNSVACLYQLHAITHSTECQSAAIIKHDSRVQQVLQDFEEVFAKPTTLPPFRQEDHQIHLEPGTKAVSVRPYRYPHFQKTEIEKMVKEMLSSGVIRPSLSPFSSPALLVKKKDGTWRFCVDYRALN
ncbi:uncharacterized protein LOC133287007 [Gastrolobium bilobum]|uniref:uncharacterized protein LOC133287007 n=1 Tax=Gastrolobium bilobum TaxID=150636 RepID=UPI002AB1A8C6|nr:uncharacterized protein LOC133287007 [Gastrolobium bilobum]